MSLATSKLLTFPDDVKSQMLDPDANSFDPEASFWTKSNHADAMVRVFRGGAAIKQVGLRTFEMLTLPADADAWEQTTPKQLAERVEARLHDTSEIERVSDLMANGKTPQTFLFKNRDGKTGVLQILGILHVLGMSGGGVKVRNKLVQGGEPMAAVSRAAPESRRHPLTELFINNHKFGADNGCSSDFPFSGQATSGHPGHVSEVTWKFLHTESGGDIYEITRKYPSDAPSAKIDTKEITYAGKVLTLWEDDTQKIILRPRQ